jgi:hypothetical protein
MREGKEGRVRVGKERRREGLGEKEKERRRRRRGEEEKEQTYPPNSIVTATLYTPTSSSAGTSTAIFPTQVILSVISIE